MSSKISALPASTVFSDTDVLCALVGGANQKATRQIFLTLTPGESCAINDGTAQIGIDPTGAIQVARTPIGGTSGMLVNAAGDVAIVGPAGVTMSFAVGVFGVGLLIDAAGDVFLSTGTANSVFVAYVPVTPANWAGSPPFHSSAIDRIAAALATLLGFPIP